MHQPIPPSRARAWVLLAVALATAAKLYCAATTIGTGDSILFRIFGRIIAEQGMAHLYNLSPEFNHTPLVGLWAAGAWLLGKDSAFGQPFLLRLPGILADVVTIAALWRLSALRGSPSPRAIVIAALCPIFFIVSGFHGNVDSVLTMFMFLAAFACYRENALWCGICLGMSANIKVVGLLLAPVFFFHFFERRKWRPFLLGTAVTVLLGWSYALSVCPEKFIGNVLGYNSFWGLWGITYLLMRTGLPEFQNINHTGLPPGEQFVMTLLKVTVILCVLTLAWKRRKERDVLPTIAAVWACFFAFSPGGSPHYFIWPLPVLVAASPRLALAVFAPASIYLFLSYDAASGGMPWMRADHRGFAPMFAGHLWADIAWGIFLIMALREIASLFPQTREVASAVLSAGKRGGDHPVGWQDEHQQRDDAEQRTFASRSHIPDEACRPVVGTTCAAPQRRPHSCSRYSSAQSSSA